MITTWVVAALVMGLVHTSTWGDELPGQELKFSQKPIDALTLTDGGGTTSVYWGHDEDSTIYGDHVSGKYGTAIMPGGFVRRVHGR